MAAVDVKNTKGTKREESGDLTENLVRLGGLVEKKMFGGGVVMEKEKKN